MDWLLRNEFVKIAIATPMNPCKGSCTVTYDEPHYEMTKLGGACVASALSPQEGLVRVFHNVAYA